MPVRTSRTRLPRRPVTHRARRVLALGVLLAGARQAAAHGFGQRYDLPIPLPLYLVAAGAAVALSFAVMLRFGGERRAAGDFPRFDLLRLRAARVLAAPPSLACLRGLCLALFLVVLIAGLAGRQDPFHNVVPTAVWIIWWVGMTYVCALLGNLWALVNPWNAAFAGAEALWRRARGAPLSRHLPLPAALGAWPAVALFLAFAWAELVWPERDVPRRLAGALLVYSGITWAGMLAFGRERWLRCGEAFAVAFSIIARFSPMEAEADAARRHWTLRPWAVGLLQREPVHASIMAFVLLMLCTVTFDGFVETPLWAAIFERALDSPLLAPAWRAIHAAGVDVRPLIVSLGLIGFYLLFVATYLGFARLMAMAAGGGVPGLARRFVLTLVPIALAYHLAHYLSYFLIAGQFIIPLISDPLGFGWDLFGTRLYRVDISVVNARTVWYTAVAAIVTGHIVAVYLAHVTARRIYADPRRARRSQYPMLALMIGYTMVSLWILAQPIVEYRG